MLMAHGYNHEDACVYFKETGPPARWNDQYNSILFCETTMMISTLKPFCHFSKFSSTCACISFTAFPKGVNVSNQGKLRVPTTPCPACDGWYGLRIGRQWDLSSRSTGCFNQPMGFSRDPPPIWGRKSWASRWWKHKIDGRFWRWGVVFFLVFRFLMGEIGGEKPLHSLWVWHVCWGFKEFITTCYNTNVKWCDAGMEEHLFVFFGWLRASVFRGW